MNQWVREETKGRINQVLSPEDIDETTKLVLANAVYLKATWMDKFDPDDTAADTFHNLDGSETQVAMMYQEEELQYYEEEGLQVVTLPYKGGHTKLILILPQPGRYQEVEQELTGDILSRMDELTRLRTVLLHMPRFNTESTLDLKPVLNRLGITDLFDPGAANLSGIDGHSCQTDTGTCLNVDQATHQAFINVNEEGTEAAAGSVAAGTLTAGGPQEAPVEMRVDRPFIYGVQEGKTDTAIFLGRITVMDAENAGKMPYVPENQHDACDQILKLGLDYFKEATDAQGMQDVVPVVKEYYPECDLYDWNPTPDDRNARGGCWQGNVPRLNSAGAVIGNTAVPSSLFESSGEDEEVRITSGRDEENNIIVYWSKDQELKPHDGADCWLYNSRLTKWDSQ